MIYDHCNVKVMKIYRNKNKDSFSCQTSMNYDSTI